jgi:sugar phosphate permease
VLFPSLVVALGMGLAFVPLTILAMSGVREADSGLASGVLATAQQIGQAVGLAVLTSVAAASETLTAGFQDAFLVAAAFALVAGLVALAPGRSAAPVAAIAST